MKIEKQASVTAAGTADEAQLAKINLLTKSPLSAADVYVFSVRLCDDRIDRDFERFNTEALSPLAKLFIGKTGIADHDWQSEKQTARIFDAGVEYENGCAYIRAWAYMLRSEKNAELIREIEAGIKKEVSVGCAMAKSVCSICGADYGSCEHRKGQTYGNSTCVAVLCEPVDAYEFSFVAVPAQREAGVLKKLGEKPQPPEALQKQAQLGQRYEAELRLRVKRLALLADCGLSDGILEKMISALSVQELSETEKMLHEKTAPLFGAVSQLSSKKEAADGENSAFLI